MAKLLREFVSFDKLEVIKEDNDEKGKKIYKLRGPFLEAETKNKNGRKYPLPVLEREVKNFVENKIKTNRSMGELDHPDDPQIHLERVSHVIEDLKMEDNLGMGVARIIDTPMGRIAETLVREGIVLGMSTRGVGSLDGDVVKDDYTMITCDIVCDPSAPSAFVEGVLENKEYVIGEGGDIVEIAVQNLKKKVDKSYESRHALGYLLDFIEDIRKNR